MLRADRLRRGQSGQSLIEGLISIFLVGTVVLTLLALLSAIILSSAKQRGVVVASNEATSIAEAVEGLAYLPCGVVAPVDYSSADDNLRSGYTAQFAYQYLQPPVSGTPSSFGACPTGGDRGVQKVSVQVSMNAPPWSKATIEVVKRNKTCPVGAVVISGQEC